MRLVPLFEMAYRYIDRHAVELDGPRGEDGLYWMFREGTLVGERLRGGHKGMNLSTRRVDDVATSDVRGVIETDDGATIVYEWRGYGLPGGDLRQVVAALTFRTADPRYRWLNPVVAIAEGRYRWGEDGRLIGTAQVFECAPDFDQLPARGELHPDLPTTVPASPPTPLTEH